MAWPDNGVSPTPLVTCSITLRLILSSTSRNLAAAPLYQLAQSNRCIKEWFTVVYVVICPWIVSTLAIRYNSILDSGHGLHLRFVSFSVQVGNLNVQEVTVKIPMKVNSVQ